MTKNSKQYYKKFNYRIEKKLSVEDNPIIKDYAKLGLYIYIIHENTDNNRFIFISNNHYELNTEIRSETFMLKKIDVQTSTHIKKGINNFGEVQFRVMKNKSDIELIFKELEIGKTNIVTKFKTHTKKLAIDNPSWYIDKIKSIKALNYKKKFEKEVLCENEYSPEIFEHFISTLFILRIRKFQKFNDHVIVFDEGKTGKSTMISYLGEKADNVSIAGLYGSSDSKAGKFRGGLITLTQKPIIIDEVNELLEDKKNEKILSILNTILENGVYNYVKQFSGKIKSSNQFIFLGNISDKFNFSYFLELAIGNNLTFGRRIGIITYNMNLKGFKKGNLRDDEYSPYVNAISNYLSKILEYIITQNKFLKKLNSHPYYNELEEFYKKNVTQVMEKTEDETLRQFLKSHRESIDRVFFRSLKLYIYNNLNEYVLEQKPFYSNHLIYEVLKITKLKLEQNIINFNNIVDHINNSSYTERKIERNKINHQNLPKSYLNLLRVFFENQDIISIKGTPYSQLKNITDVRKQIYHIKERGISQNLKSILLHHGCRITHDKENNVINFAFVNKTRFLDLIEGIFEEKKEEIDVKSLAIDEDIV
jgi:hypothetical protein